MRWWEGPVVKGRYRSETSFCHLRHLWPFNLPSERENNSTLEELHVSRGKPLRATFDKNKPHDGGVTAVERNLLSVSCFPAQARRSREQSRSASALSISGGEEKSEHSADQRLSTYSDGAAFFSATSSGTSRLSQVGLVLHGCNRSLPAAPAGGLHT